MAEEKKEEQTETKEETAAEAKAEGADASEDKEVEVPEKFKELVSTIEEMTVLELSELVKVLEDKFGVSSAAPMMVAGAATGGDEAGGGEESSTVTVELTDGGSNKIAVIKALREVLPDLGLKDAKEFVEAAPKPVKEGIERAEGEEIKGKLEEAGASVTLK